MNSWVPSFCCVVHCVVMFISHTCTHPLISWPLNKLLDTFLSFVLSIPVYYILYRNLVNFVIVLFNFTLHHVKIFTRFTLHHVRKGFTYKILKLIIIIMTNLVHSVSPVLESLSVYPQAGALYML